MEQKPLFVLGAGAPKSGTTWVYHYLAHCGHGNMGLTKEYHIWDATLLKHKPVSVRADQVATHELFALRYCLQQYDQMYELYFKSLISDTHWITGDLTPAYGQMNQEQFLHVKTKLERVGFQVKVIYLMRDPFERCCSQTHMDMRLAHDKTGKTFSVEEENALFVQDYQSPSHVGHTQYEHHLATLQSTFSKDELFIGIYEELFEDATLQSLARFLGLDEQQVLTFKNNKVQTRTTHVHISDAIIDDCRHFYAQTYAYCHEHFPQTKTLWGRPPKRNQTTKAQKKVFKNLIRQWLRKDKNNP